MPDGTKTIEESIQIENQLSTWNYFPSTVYSIERPDFLKSVNEVSEKFLEISKSKNDLDPIFPVIMTENLYNDERMMDFMAYVGMTAWNILNSQGYAMNDLQTTFSEMWTQEHHKHSLMEQHIHGFGSQLVGFYFLEVPEKSSDVIFYDPRAGKVQNNLPESQNLALTQASNAVYIKPKPGLLMFANSWLPHAFSRHASDQPLKFVHFNITVKQNTNAFCPPPAEVV